MAKAKKKTTKRVGKKATKETAAKGTVAFKMGSIEGNAAETMFRSIEALRAEVAEIKQLTVGMVQVMRQTSGKVTLPPSGVGFLTPDNSTQIVNEIVNKADKSVATGMDLFGATPQAAPTNGETTITKEELSTVLQQIGAQKGFEPISDIFQKHGATKFDELAISKYATVMAEARAL